MVLDLTHVGYVDTDGFNAFREIVQYFRSQSQMYAVAGLQPGMKRYDEFMQAKWFEELAQKGSSFSFSAI